MQSGMHARRGRTLESWQASPDCRKKKGGEGGWNTQQHVGNLVRQAAQEGGWLAGSGAGQDDASEPHQLTAPAPTKIRVQRTQHWGWALGGEQFWSSSRSTSILAAVDAR